MYGISFPVVVSWSLAATLVIAGLVQMGGSRMVRAAYANWEFPAGLSVVTGALEIIAAVGLAMPELRVWGILLTAFIMFGAVVTLLSHRQYLYAVPAIMLMAALVPAALAIPHAGHHVHYAAGSMATISVPI
jgi:hypothetical protein